MAHVETTKSLPPPAIMCQFDLTNLTEVCRL